MAYQQIPPTVPNIQTALSHITADEPRDEWVKTLAAIKSELGDDGRDIAESHSRNGQTFSAADFRDTWKSIKPDGGITIGTLWRKALDAGWKPDGAAYQETEAERQARERQREERKRKAEQDAKRKRAEAAKKAAALWKASTDLRADHPYVARKGIKPVPALHEIGAEQAAGILRYHPKSGGEPLAGRLIIAPVKVGGKLSTLEFIDEHGRKSAIAGGAKSGGFWATQALPEGDGTGLVLAIGEGVATALSTHQATDYPAIAALSAGNIPEVAKIMRDRYPKARLLILADLGNGQAKAEEAAKATGAALAVPAFTPEQIQAFEQQHGKAPTDFNDMHQIAGLDAVRGQIAAALAEPAPPPTDAKQQKQKEREEKIERMKAWAKTLPLVYVNDQGKPALVKQSKAAKLLASELPALAYDSIAGHWIEYRGGCFAQISEARAYSAVIAAIDERGGDAVGYDAAYPAGIMAFLKARLNVEGFDEQPGFIPFTNGVLDIRTGDLKPHSPDYRLTWQLPYPYVPGVDCSTVIDWLRQAAGGYEEVQVIRAFIRAMLTGRADLQRYLEVLGPAGSGKGTFLRLLTSLAGEKNSHSTTMAKLENNRFETANLRGKRLVQITDAEKHQGDTSIFKAVTGDDFLPYEAKHRQGGESFRFGGMVVIAANNSTTQGDYSGALHRRRVTIRFDHVVDPSQRRDLQTEFAPCLSGVIAWALAMPESEMESLLRDTDRQSERMAAASIRALIDVNPVARWADDMLILAPGNEIKVGIKKSETVSEGDGFGGPRISQTRIKDAGIHLYPAYAQWCMDHGQKDLGQVNFTSALESVLCQQVKLPGVARLKNSNGKGSRFAGIRLRTDFDGGIQPMLSSFFSTGRERVKNDSSMAGSRESIGSMSIDDVFKDEEKQQENSQQQAEKTGGTNDEKMLETKTGVLPVLTRTVHTPQGLQPYCPPILTTATHTDTHAAHTDRPPLASCRTCRHWSGHACAENRTVSEPDATYCGGWMTREFASTAIREARP